MTRYLLVAAPLLMSCSALAQPPLPSLSPAKLEQLEEQPMVRESDGDETSGDEMSDDDMSNDTMADIDAEVQDTLASLDTSVDQDDPANVTTFGGPARQGSLVTGKTRPGASIKLVTHGENDAVTDSRDVPVDDYGNFVFGIDRDHGPKAVLMVTYPGQGRGEPEAIPVPVTSKAWRESSITVEESKANPYKQEDLDKIAADSKKKNAARRASADSAMWITGFSWPTDGCVSSEFGSRRIVNGTPRRFHSGVDVAAPDGMSPMDYIGTEVRAPADGVVKLAEDDMFFEGGLIFIDHGQELYTYLMHMSAVDVSAGDEVRMGDPVGKVGMSGRVTGPHLHWSLKWQDRLLDPTSTVSELAACTD